MFFPEYFNFYPLVSVSQVCHKYKQNDIAYHLMLLFLFLPMVFFYILQVLLCIFQFLYPLLEGSIAFSAQMFFHAFGVLQP